MRKRGALLGLAWLGAVGCGGDTVLLVEVDLTAFAIPAEIDQLFLEMRENTPAAPVLLGRTFALEANESRPVVELIRGPRTPKTFGLVVYGFLGAQLVAQAESKTVSFVPGEAVSASFVLTP